MKDVEMSGQAMMAEMVATMAATRKRELLLPLLFGGKKTATGRGKKTKMVVLVVMAKWHGRTTIMARHLLPRPAVKIRRAVEEAQEVGKRRPGGDTTGTL
jgi:hypothetical protein